MNSAQNNDSTIDKAASRFQSLVFNRNKEAMKELLKKAVVFALTSHDERHHQHLEIGDSYGWALWYEGSLVEREITANSGESEGNAEQALQNITLPSKGWLGVVLAGMRPINYFATDYEMQILIATANMTRDNYREYFKSM